MFDPDIKLKYAGFWNRFLAFIIDHIILGFVRILFLAPISGFLDFDNLIQNGNEREYFVNHFPVQYDDPAFLIAATFLSFIFMFFMNTLVGWLYYALFESSSKKATPGKLVLGIIVTDIFGRRIGFGKATGRYFSKYLSSMIIFAGYIMAAFTEKKQALHDILANCVVIYDEKYQKIKIPSDDQNNQNDYPVDFII